MVDQVKPSRRRYHSPLRAGQAEQTRHRILESAFRLFARNGYAGTTIAAVAQDAGVSPETIYISLGGKRGLFEGAIEMAIRGADDASAEDDKWSTTVARLPDATARLESIVGYSCMILARTRPIPCRHPRMRARRSRSPRRCRPRRSRRSASAAPPPAPRRRPAPRREACRGPGGSGCRSRRGDRFRGWAAGLDRGAAERRAVGPGRRDVGAVDVELHVPARPLRSRPAPCSRCRAR